MIFLSGETTEDGLLKPNWDIFKPCCKQCKKKSSSNYTILSHKWHSEHWSFYRRSFTKELTQISNPNYWKPVTVLWRSRSLQHYAQQGHFLKTSTSPRSLSMASSSSGWEARLWQVTANQRRYLIKWTTGRLFYHSLVLIKGYAALSNYHLSTWKPTMSPSNLLLYTQLILPFVITIYY